MLKHLTLLQTVALLTAVLALPRLAYAQAPPAVERLVSEALRRNPALQAERLDADRADAAVRGASALLLPTVSVESRYSRQNGTLDLGELVNPAYAALNELTGSAAFPTDLEITLPLRHESRVRLIQPVINVAAWANRSAATHARDARQWQVEAAARQLAAAVQTAYLRAVSARSAVEIRESALTRAAEAERVAQRLVGAGHATPDALFSARAERSDAEQRLAEAREQAATAARAVNQLAHRDLEAPLESVEESDLLRDIELSRAEAEASALARREELNQLDAGMRAADAGARASGAAYLPALAVVLDYGVQGQELRLGSDNNFVVGSVVLSWNAFDGGAAASRRSSARAEASALRARRADVESRILLDVAHAWESAVVAHQAIGTAEDRLGAATRAYELVRRRYEEGVARHIELIDARTTLTAAELNRSRTVHEYAMRLVELERAAALRTIDGGRMP